MSPADAPIRVVFAVDGGYAMPLAAAICSIVANMRGNTPVHFHVLHSGFSAPLRAKVETSLDGMGLGRASIEWHEASLERLQHLPSVHANTSKLFYLRLLIPELLPDSIDKVLYLDADLIVLDDINALWAEPMEETALLAVRDRIGPVSSPMGLRNYRDLGIPASAPYFNSGVMMLNLRSWRERSIGTRLLHYLSDHAAQLRDGDQEGLNAVLFDDWRELDFRWNWQVVPDMDRAIAAGCWGLDRLDKGIVHFVTSAKPWLPGSRYAERDLFFHYLDLTAWRGWRVPVPVEAKAALKRTIRRVVERLSFNAPKTARRA